MAPAQGAREMVQSALAEPLSLSGGARSGETTGRITREP